MFVGRVAAFPRCYQVGVAAAQVKGLFLGLKKVVVSCKRFEELAARIEGTGMVLVDGGKVGVRSGFSDRFGPQERLLTARLDSAPPIQLNGHIRSSPWSQVPQLQEALSTPPQQLLSIDTVATAPSY